MTMRQYWLYFLFTMLGLSALLSACTSNSNHPSLNTTTNSSKNNSHRHTIPSPSHKSTTTPKSTLKYVGTETDTLPGSVVTAEWSFGPLQYATSSAPPLEPFQACNQDYTDYVDASAWAKISVTLDDLSGELPTDEYFTADYDEGSQIGYNADETEGILYTQPSYLVLTLPGGVEECDNSGTDGDHLAISLTAGQVITLKGWLIMPATLTDTSPSSIAQQWLNLDQFIGMEPAEPYNLDEISWTGPQSASCSGYPSGYAVLLPFAQLPFSDDQGESCNAS